MAIEKLGRMEENNHETKIISKTRCVIDYLRSLQNNLLLKALCSLRNVVVERFLDLPVLSKNFFILKKAVEPLAQE